MMSKSSFSTLAKLSLLFCLVSCVTLFLVLRFGNVAEQKGDLTHSSEEAGTSPVQITVADLVEQFAADSTSINRFSGASIDIIGAVIGSFFEDDSEPAISVNTGSPSLRLVVRLKSGKPNPSAEAVGSVVNFQCANISSSSEVITCSDCTILSDG